MSDEPSESTVRSAARRIGWRVEKSRDRSTHVDNHGLFRLVNDRNCIEAGERFDLTLTDIAGFIADEHEARK